MSARDDVIEAMARGLFKRQCERADEDERREGREPPEKWADPWAPHGINQRKLLYAEAEAAYNALRAAGFRIVPYKPTEAMIRAGGVRPNAHTRKKRIAIHRAMLDVSDREGE